MAKCPRRSLWPQQVMTQTCGRKNPQRASRDLAFLGSLRHQRAPGDKDARRVLKCRTPDPRVWSDSFKGSENHGRPSTWVPESPCCACPELWSPGCTPAWAGARAGSWPTASPVVGPVAAQVSTAREGQVDGADMPPWEVRKSPETGGTGKGMDGQPDLGAHVLATG